MVIPANFRQMRVTLDTLYFGLVIKISRLVITILLFCCCCVFLIKDIVSSLYKKSIILFSISLVENLMSKDSRTVQS